VVVLLGVDTEGKAKGKGFLRPCQNSKMIVTDDECQKDPIFCIWGLYSNSLLLKPK